MIKVGSSQNCNKIHLLFAALDLDRFETPVLSHNEQKKAMQTGLISSIHTRYPLEILIRYFNLVIYLQIGQYGYIIVSTRNVSDSTAIALFTE